MRAGSRPYETATCSASQREVLQVFLSKQQMGLVTSQSLVITTGLLGNELHQCAERVNMLVFVET